MHLPTWQLKVYIYSLFINKIPRNQRHKLFYLLCNVMLFVFLYICNKLPLRKAARPQRTEINLEFFVYTFVYIYIYIT